MRSASLANGRQDTSAFVHVRLSEKDVVRFQRRLDRLVADVHRAADPEGTLHALAFALFPSTVALPPRDDDA
jgi:hypothetical protein